MTHYLYILRSEVKEAYYVGVTNDLDRRLYFHNHGHEGYTKRWRPWKIVYHHPFDTKEKAMAMESVVKGWKSKRMIVKLVEGEIDILEYE